MFKVNAVVNSNGHASISSVAENLNKALIFRDEQGDLVCDECCDCQERCQSLTGGYGCVLRPEGDEVGTVVLSGASSGFIDDECENVTGGLRFKSTTLSGNGALTYIPTGNGFSCRETGYSPEPPRGETIYGPGTPPDFCGDCEPCPNPSAPRALHAGLTHDMQLESKTISVEPGGCSGTDGAPSDNYACFGELEGVDSVTIPDAQSMRTGSVELHTEIFNGECFGECFGSSWHNILYRINVVFSPVTDRFAGVIFSRVTGTAVGATGDEFGSINIASVVAIIRGGFVGLRYDMSATSTATFFGKTRTRSGSAISTMNFPHWGVCCTSGSQREEDVVLVGPGGPGAAFASDPVFHREKIVIRPPRKHRQRRSCSGCRSSKLAFPTAAEVKRVAGSRAR